MSEQRSSVAAKPDTRLTAPPIAAVLRTNIDSVMRAAPPNVVDVFDEKNSMAPPRSSAAHAVNRHRITSIKSVPDAKMPPPAAAALLPVKFESRNTSRWSSVSATAPPLVAVLLSNTLATTVLTVLYDDDRVWKRTQPPVRAKLPTHTMRSRYNAASVKMAPPKPSLASSSVTAGASKRAPMPAALSLNVSPRSSTLSVNSSTYSAPPTRLA
mmetsp:Transcript_28383/g.69020  ORF Transcript_28383/g.69020 Transcript_28383/m.69020 type:complete len:212 (+) Transcript_28383:1502-2137(+)